MKKIILFGSILCLVYSCKNEEECITCSNSNKIWTNGIDTINIPNAFTPNNYALCDSFVYVPSQNAYMEPSFLHSDLKLVCTKEEKSETPQKCPCVENSNSSYNDSKNASLFIRGIDHFPSNIFSILDTKNNVITTIENYNNSTNYFQGYVLDTTSDVANFKHLTGEYNYKLYLYSDTQKSNIVTTITGSFYMIRTPQDCGVTGCEGVDKNDPLLQ